MLNRQTPAQPGPAGSSGSGGTGPVLGPAVCVHDVGWLAANATLWKFAAVRVAERHRLAGEDRDRAGSPVSGFWNAKSTAMIVPGARDSPDASAGMPAAATAAQANHGRYLFLSPTRPPPGW